jgi:hypothetical protein
VRRISDDERRSRLRVRHHLARSARGGRIDLVAGDIAGLHATDPATLVLSAQARLREPSLEAIGDALYVKRSIVRMLCMRRTMFVVPVDFAPVVQGACTRGRARRAQALHRTAGARGDRRRRGPLAAGHRAAHAARAAGARGRRPPPG